MKKYTISAMVLGAGLALGVTGPAWATTCNPNVATTSPIFDTANGTTTFPGTFVGAIGTGAGQVNQIGDLCLFNSGGAGAFVSNSSPSSIYSFSWIGGLLKITEEQGNNGTGPIAAELYLLTSGLPGPALGTTSFAQHNDSFDFHTLFDGFLAGGTYAIDTHFITTGIDPNYQINFVATPLGVPEPLTLSLFGAGVLGVAAIRSRRRTKKA